MKKFEYYLFYISLIFFIFFASILYSEHNHYLILSSLLLLLLNYLVYYRIKKFKNFLYNISILIVFISLLGIIFGQQNTFRLKDYIDNSRTKAKFFLSHNLKKIFKYQKQKPKKNNINNLEKFTYLESDDLFVLTKRQGNEISILNHKFEKNDELSYYSNKVRVAVPFFIFKNSDLLISSAWWDSSDSLMRVNSKFEIIAGERRWLAAQRAGLHEVPVVITEADDLKSLEFAIVENVQRHDLNPLEEAQGYKRLIDEFSYDQEKVSKFIGKSRSYITNSLRLLTLPISVLKFVEEKKISAGHAKIIVGLDNAEFIANKIIEKKLSVRQTENFVKVFKKKRGPLTKLKDPNIQDLQDSISQKIGLNVSIKNSKRNKGNITLNYKDLSQLNRIIEILKKYY